MGSFTPPAMLLARRMVRNSLIACVKDKIQLLTLCCVAYAFGVALGTGG
jgi:hypothetical protein